jgi:hypothetical protein
MGINSDTKQISIAASFEKQTKDQIEQTSECDPLDNSEASMHFDLDDSASAIDLDNM